MSTQQNQVYTTDHSKSVLRTHSWRTVSNSAGYLMSHIQPNMTILDVGCGPGTITIDMASLVPHGHITGVEYKPEPLEEAQAAAAAQNTTNVSFKVGDIHSLPFEDNTFDIVHAHQVLQHISDPVSGLREMRRVTKPGGLVASRESASFTWYPDSAGLDAWMRLTTKMGKAKGGDPHPGRFIHVWAVEAGFARADITTSAGSWCFSSDEEREYWGGSMEGRIRGSGFRDMALGEGFATSEDLEEIARGWRAFREDPNAWFGLLHGEMLCRKN